MILDLARAASAAGFEMSVLATGSGALASEFASLGAGLRSSRRRFPIDPLLVSRIRGVLPAGRFDVIHAHQAVTGVHAWLAATGTPSACCLSIHGYAPGSRKEAAALSFLLPRVDRRIAVSRGFLDRLRRQLPAARGVEFNVVYNGIDARRLAVPVHDLRSELGLAPDTLLLGMVGNFQRWKDQATVCRAFPRVLAHAPNACLVFVGAASRPECYEPCLRICRENETGNRVRFLGPRPDVPALLPNLDLFVFSSLEDTFGIAMLEAMLAGVPCVVSDIPPLVEMTGNGEVAVLFRTGDADDLATALVRLIDDREGRIRLARTGQTWVRGRFTIEHHAHALAALYQAAAGSSRCAD